MQAVHPVLDDAVHVARIILLAVVWGSSELWVCETMPAFVGEAVGRLDIMASDPTIVQMNTLVIQPAAKIQDHVPYSAVAFQTILGCPVGHPNLNHCAELLWTLDSVATQHVCKQNAEDQVDVFMCMPHWQKIQSACVKVACSHQVSQELSDQ